MSGERDYRRIVDHYESCLALHGDSHLGVDWPNAEDAETRHRVMLDVMRPRVLAEPVRPAEPVRLLDFGCGASHLYEHIVEQGLDGIEYVGVDLSERFIELSRSKFPANEYRCLDILTCDDPALGRFDYAVMNGVFTIKRDLSFDRMFELLTQIVTKVFSLVDIGLAFNVMSTHVEWERDDLFHVPFDVLAAWLTEHLGRDFVFRNDYGLYEYTTYVYR